MMKTEETTRLRIKIANDSRSATQIEEHYSIEKELAKQLLNATKEERRYLYTALYDELYRRVTHHPRWTRKSNLETTKWIVAQRMQLLRRFLDSHQVYLEVGPGDCSLANEVAKKVKKVYAVDVATEVTKDQIFPHNFEFIVSDGCSIPVPENSVTLAYSHQLMEHLHPDDAFEQLQNIYGALMVDGLYICITPNRLSGPHDISKYFDESATGFHLKEYTVTELYMLFRQAGFSKLKWIKNNGNIHIEIPLNQVSVVPIKILETVLGLLPYPIRKKLANTPMFFRGMTIMGIK